MGAFMESAEASQAEGVLGNALFMKAFAAAKPITDERSQIWAECENQLMHHIRRGALRGFAFEAPRTHGAIPIELSPRVWNGKLDWHKNKITHESLSFVEVRLITARKTQTFLDSKAVVKIPPKPVSIVHTSPKVHEPPNRGRPTVKKEVEQAFRALHADNRINIQLSSKSHYPLIREWLSDNAKGLSVRPTTMSDETIRRITAPLFNALKDNQ